MVDISYLSDFDLSIVGAKIFEKCNFSKLEYDEIVGSRPNECDNIHYSSRSIYMTAIKKFIKKKNKSIVDDLYKHITEVNKALVEDNYNHAIADLLNDDRIENAVHNKFTFKLTVKIVQHIHTLIFNGVMVPAGNIRDREVKVGNDRTFSRAANVHQDLESYVKSFNDQLNKDINPIVFAAWTLCTFIRVHPFRDGNGRVSRILSNVALHLTGHPFFITYCSCPRQKKTYNQCFSKNIGYPNKILNDMVIHMYDNVYKGWLEFDNELVSYLKSCASQSDVTNSTITLSDQMIFKPDSSIDEEEEEDTSEKCSICWEQHPSVSVLCCKQNFHVTCLNKLVVSPDLASRCPCCRAVIMDPILATVNIDDTEDGTLLEIQEHDFFGFQEDSTIDDSTSDYDYELPVPQDDTTIDCDDTENPFGDGSSIGD